MGLEWRSELSVGNDIIDCDHMHLIEIINRVESNLKTRNNSGISASIAALRQYSELHFNREEIIAKAAGYTNCSILHDSHEALLKKPAQLELELKQDLTPQFIEQFTLLIRDWLINHVIRQDLPMKPYLTKLSPRFDPR